MRNHIGEELEQKRLNNRVEWWNAIIAVTLMSILIAQLFVIMK